MNHETSWNYQCAAICDKLQKKSGKLLTRILDANLLNSLEYSSIFSLFTQANQGCI